MKIAILYSGGFDSAMLKKYAEVRYPDAEVSCVYYAHGAESEKAEIETLPDYVDVKTIDWLGDKHKALAKDKDPVGGAIYIPGRNMIFFALAASQYLPDEVWMGTLFDEDHDVATDKNEYFRDRSSSLMSYVLSPFIDGVELRFPYVEEEWCKKDVVEWALNNGVSEEEILKTTSCWHNDGIPCGRCKQCFKRRLMLHWNGIEDTNYKIDPMESPEAQKYIDHYTSEGVVEERGETARLIHYWQTGEKLLD